MTSQFRLASGSYTFDFAANGWHVPVRFNPLTANLIPIIASGLPSSDYVGGELVDEFVGDMRGTLPLIYKGDSPKAARRKLDSFIRRGVAGGNLRLQERQDRAFSIEPLWGQWGAWQTIEVIHAGALTIDSRTWEGYDGEFAELPLICKPAVTGQPQQVGNARGSVAESFGDDGLSQGVVIPQDAESSIILPSSKMDSSAGTVIVAWERIDSTGPTGIADWPMFYQATGLQLYFDGTNTWVFTDGTNTAELTGVAFPSLNTLMIFHCVYGDGDLSLYVNGVLAETSSLSAFTPADINIGSDDKFDNQPGGLYRLFSTYDTAMSAAEVAADYADIVATLAVGPSPSPIPYIITLDGDGVLDNATDASGSTDAPHQNYGWIAGVTGTLPAKMELRLFPSVMGSACKRLAVSLLDYDDVFALEASSAMYYDASGTANAASSGGAYLSTTINTTFTLQINTTQPAAVYQRLQGRELAVYMRAQSGSTGAFQSKLALVVGDTIVSAAKNHVTATGFRMLRTPFLSMPRQSAAEIADAAESFTQLYAGRSTGSGTALIDYGVVMPRPLVEIDTSGMGALGVAIYEATANRYSGTGIVWASLPRIGDVLRPRPHRYNCLTLVMGDETVDPLISWYALTEITITPRWSII